MIEKCDLYLHCKMCLEDERDRPVGPYQIGLSSMNNKLYVDCRQHGSMYELDLVPGQLENECCENCVQ